MVDELPPYDASPGHLQELCEVLREGEIERDDLLQKLSMKETAFDQNADYGVQLGFIEYSDSVYSATRRGQQIGYGNLPRDREHGIFRDSINEHPVYPEFLSIAQQEIREINDTDAISRDDLTRELRIEYDYDVTDRTLDSVANTFLKTLDAAGLGSHKTGRKGYPTRFEIGEDFRSFVEDTPVAEEDQATAEKRLGERPQEQLIEDVASSGAEARTKANGHSEPGLENRQSPGRVPNPVVNINIDISAAEWDSAEVVKLIQEIRKLNRG